MTKPRHVRKARAPFWARRNVLIVTGITAVFVAIAVPAIGAMANGVSP
jgi:hypothetical protein